MSIPRVSNSEMSDYVCDRKAFTNTNQTCWGEWKTPEMYVVYSYGTHFPIYVWDEHMGWLANTDKFSVTTSRHQNQAHPRAFTRRYDTADIKKIVQAGSYTKYVADRITITPEQEAA